MNHHDLTDDIVKLCQDCTVWSSNITIPQGDGEILDITSAAQGAQSSSPVGAKDQPDNYPKGVCYMFDPNVYGENSWPSLHAMLTKVGCVSR